MRVPDIEFLTFDNVRTGFLERAEIEPSLKDAQLPLLLDSSTTSDAPLCGRSSERPWIPLSR